MIEFHGYGFFVGLGVLASLQVSFTYAKRIGIKRRIVEEVSWWVLLGGLIGARTYHVLDLWQEYYHFNYLKSLFLWEGGLGIWGGIMGGVMGLGGYIITTKFHSERVYVEGWRLFKRQKPSEEKFLTRELDKDNKTTSFLSLMDVTMVGVPLGQAIGRLGNWVNGELYGRKGEPLFIWEAVLDLILFVILWKILATKSFRKKSSIGKTSGGYLLGYGLIRILLENFRPEEIIWRWQGIPVAVIMGIMAMVFGVYVISKGKLS